MYGRPTRPLLSTTGSFIARYHAGPANSKPKPKSKFQPPSRERPPPRKLSKDEQTTFSLHMSRMVETVANDRKTFKRTDRDAKSKLATVLNSTIPSPRNRASVEKVAFDAEVHREMTSVQVDDELDAGVRKFDPGTFVELRKPHSVVTGVVLGTLYQDKTLSYSTLLQNGDVWIHDQDHVMFEVPNMFPADLVARCGRTSAVENPNQLAARVEILKRVRQVSVAIENTSSNIHIPPESLYDSLAHPDPTKATTTTAAEAARLLFPNPSMRGVYAAHSFLLENPLYFMASYDYQISHNIILRPREKVENMKTVTEWTKLADGPIQSFVKKAKEVQERNIKLRESTRFEEPQIRPVEYVWDENDRRILVFLQDSLKFTGGAQIDPSVVGTCFIVKQLIPDVPVKDETVSRLLHDLAVLAPWGDLVPEAADLLKLDRDGKESELVEKSFAARSTASSSEPLGLEDFYPSDPLASIRHDFGDMPVYVIDDPDAKELDDGISIEPVLNEPGTYWVHAHIANPTSILPPTHILAQKTDRLNETLYLYHRSFPMLPPSFTHHHTHPSSLVPGKPQNVMTFSVKVNSNHDILDYKIRAGIIQNTRRMTYDGLNLAMGWESHRGGWTFPFGGKVPSAPSPTLLEQSDHQSLQAFYNVAKNARKRRLRDGCYSNSRTMATLYGAEWPSGTDRYTPEPTEFRGFPKLMYRASSSKNDDVGAQNVVAEIMKLASRAASRFCTDRGLPMIRRYASRPIVSSESAYADLLRSRTPNGYVEFWDSYNAISYDSVGGFSHLPKEHFGLGVADGEGYVRVTSPLRRYDDLVAHWQIQNALLGKKPMFSEEWIINFTAEAATKTRRQKRLQGVHEAYYHILYIQRFLEERERGHHQDLPNPFDNLFVRTSSVPLINSSNRKFYASGNIDSLGLKVILTEAAEQIPPGSLVPARLHSMELGLRPKMHVSLK